MAEQFSPEWAQGMIDDGIERAQGLVNDPEQLGNLLEDLQQKIAELPESVATALGNVPLMASLAKSYVTREYTEVSPEVVNSLVSAISYLVRQKDLIPDDIPVVGFADDVAVATIASTINEPELKAYKLWREQNGVSDRGVQMGEIPVEVEAEIASSVPASPQASIPEAPIEVDAEIVE